MSCVQPDFCSDISVEHDRCPAHTVASPTCHSLEYVDWADVPLNEPMRIEDRGAVVPDRRGIGPGWDGDAVARYWLG
jgi:L-alanine-DL-glutamate epimerase-like enolase superfamily enzyme